MSLNLQANILIVDDVPANLIALSVLLKQVHANVITANSGNEALAIALEHELAVILLDAHMPDMDGYEVAEILSSNDDTRNVPIIFVTAAYKDEMNRRKGYQAGAVDYIQKPIEEEILISKVNVFLELHRSKLEQQQLIEKMELIVEERTAELLATQKLARVGGWRMNISTKEFNYDELTLEILACKQQQSLFESMESNKALEVKTLIQDTLANNLTSFEFEFGLKTQEPKQKTFYSIASVIYQSGHAIGLKGSLQDISERKESERLIEFMAQYDALTKLPNRYLFQSRLEADIARAKRSKNPLAIILIDLDHFKEINDTLGHPAGDTLLIEVASRLNGIARETDTVARLGGDEFVIIVPDIEDINDISHIAQRCIDTLSHAFVINDEKAHSGASIGISLYPEDASNTDDLLKFADLALYKSKAEGRGCFHLYNQKMQDNIQNRKSQESDIKKAISKREFELFFQPKISLSDKSVVGAEALIRWHHPNKGLLVPAEFIPLAEQSKLMISLGDWVIEEVCSIQLNWQKQKINMPISINISPSQFNAKHFKNKLFNTLEKHKITPKLIELEITESALLNYNELESNIFHDINSKGINILLDDFGIEYSSISHLKMNIAQILKIDISLVHNMLKNDFDQELVNMLIKLSHKLGMKVVAEGVESHEQEKCLTKFSCDQAQGYLYSKALSLNEFMPWLTNWAED